MNKKIFIIPILFFLVIGISFAGLTTLSVSDIGLNEDSSTGGQKAWLLNIMLEDLSNKGEYLYGTIDKNDIKDDDSSPLYDLKIKAKIDEYTCNYDINAVTGDQEEEDQRLKYWVVDPNWYGGKGDWYWNAEKLANDCGVSLTNGDFLKGTSLADNYIIREGNKAFAKFQYGTTDLTEIIYIGWKVFQCYQLNDYGMRIGKLDDPQSIFSSTFGIETTNPKYNPIEVKINPLTQTSASFPNDLGTVRWLSYSLGVKSCPTISTLSYTPIYNSNWRLADSSLVSTYQTNYKNFWSCMGITIWDASKIDSCINNLKSSYTKATGSDVKFYYDHVEYDGDSTKVKDYATITTSSSSRGQVSLPINELLFRPEFRLILLADYIGVNIPYGDPKIVSVSSEKFPTGFTGFVEATVTNVGTGDGSFLATVSCDNGVSQDGEAGKITLSPSETGSVIVRVRGTTELASQKFPCVLKVYDREKPENFDTKSFTVTVEGQTVCSSGESVCQGNLLYGCNSEGTGYTSLIEDCTERGKDWICLADKCEYNGKECSKQGEIPTLLRPCCPGLDPTGGLLGIGETCQPEQPEIPWDIIISVLAAGILSFFVYRRFEDENTEFKIGVALMSFAISAMILYFVISWLLSWWWLLALGIFGIIILIILFGGGILGAIALIKFGRR